MKSQRPHYNKGVIEKRVLLIEEYYNEVKPDMEFKEFESICKTPFLHMRHKLSSDSLYEIRFKYLGMFRPALPGVVKFFEYTQNRFDAGLIGQNMYDCNIKMLLEYVNRVPDKFKNYKERIKQWIELQN